MNTYAPWNSYKDEFGSMAWIRQEFINFFTKLGYNRVRQDRLMTAEREDALLFTNSGMIQFKERFSSVSVEDTEKGINKKPKLVNIQTCIRLSGKQNDLDMIGNSPYHHTSFEMLGLFNFNRVSRSDILRDSVVFLVQKMKLEPANLFFHVHPKDKYGIKIIKDLLQYKVTFDINVKEENAQMADPYWTEDFGKCFDEEGNWKYLSYLKPSPLYSVDQQQDPLFINAFGRNVRSYFEYRDDSEKGYPQHHNDMDKFPNFGCDVDPKELKRRKNPGYTPTWNYRLERYELMLMISKYEQHEDIRRMKFFLSQSLQSPYQQKVVEPDIDSEQYGLSPVEVEKIASAHWKKLLTASKIPTRKLRRRVLLKFLQKIKVMRGIEQAAEKEKLWKEQFRWWYIYGTAYHFRIPTANVTLVDTDITKCQWIEKAKWPKQFPKASKTIDNWRRYNEFREHYTYDDGTPHVLGDENRMALRCILPLPGDSPDTVECFQSRMYGHILSKYKTRERYAKYIDAHAKYQEYYYLPDTPTENTLYPQGTFANVPKLVHNDLLMKCGAPQRNNPFIDLEAKYPMVKNFFWEDQIVLDESCIWSTNEENCKEGFSIEIYYKQTERWSIAPQPSNRDQYHYPMLLVEVPEAVEIWNMVFPGWTKGEPIGANQKKDAVYDKSSDSGIKSYKFDENLDMGCGLERLSSVVSKTFNNYELPEYTALCDIINGVTVALRDRIVMNELKRESWYRNRLYDGDERKFLMRYKASNVDKRIYKTIYKIVDHLKTSTLLIKAGLEPGNKGRGYILRKLLRTTFKELGLIGADSKRWSAFNGTCKIFVKKVVELFIDKQWDSSLPGIFKPTCDENIRRLAIQEEIEMTYPNIQQDNKWSSYFDELENQSPYEHTYKVEINDEKVCEIIEGELIKCMTWRKGVEGLLCKLKITKDNFRRLSEKTLQILKERHGILMTDLEDIFEHG